MFYLLANWKSYKNLSQAREWFYSFRDNISPETMQAMRKEQMNIVIFPPAPLIYPLHTLCLDVAGMSVGAQDVSPYEEGKFTGLVNATSVKGMATHVIIGHVEQRKRGDNEEIVAEKFRRSQEEKLQTILCISKPGEMIPGANHIAFEPVAAIGTGQNASIDDVTNFKHQLQRQDVTFMYGGSVDEKNCSSYLKPRLVDGFLVGAVSLDAIRFAALVNACTPYVVEI